MLCALATGELSVVGLVRAARRAGPSSWRAPTPQDLFAAPPSCVGGSRRSAHGCWSILDASKRLLAGVDLMNMLGRRGAVERLAEGRASAGLPPKGWCWPANGGDASSTAPKVMSARGCVPCLILVWACTGQRRVEASLRPIGMPMRLTMARRRCGLSSRSRRKNQQERAAQQQQLACAGRASAAAHATAAANGAAAGAGRATVQQGDSEDDLKSLFAPAARLSLITYERPLASHQRAEIYRNDFSLFNTANTRHR